MQRKNILNYTRNWIKVLEKEIEYMEPSQERQLKEEQVACLKSLIDMSDMEIITPYGAFYPSKSDNPDYPGIAITFRHEHGDYEDDIAYVEYEAETESVRAFNWKNDDNACIGDQIYYDRTMYDEDTKLIG